MATATTESEVTPWRENLNAKLICKECRETPPNLVFEDYSTVCGSCGLVLADREIDLGSEWRTFANDDGKNDDPSRVGEADNPLLNGNQLETSIAFGVGGLKAKELHRAQNRITADKGNKTLLAAYKEIGGLCDSWGIQGGVASTAKFLFKQVHDSNLYKGKSQEVVIAGCIFIACRQCKVPRTFREIFSLTKVTKKEIGRIFKQLEKFFADSNHAKIKSMEQDGGIVNRETEEYTTTTSTRPRDLCSRFCNMLGLPYSVTNISQELADKMSNVGALAGRSPLSTAATCIYMASYLMGQGKTAKEISQVAGVSDGTIRTAYKLLYLEKEKLIDSAWLQEGKGDMKNLPVS